VKKLALAGIVTAMALFGVTAFAAEAAPGPVRGTISAVNGSVLKITETTGKQISLALAPGAKVIDVLPASLSDVKAGTYIGTAAIPQPNGTYRAIELKVFPESMRGVGLGTRAWNLKPNSTMTNGTIGGLTRTGGTVGTVGTVSGSSDLTLKVNDGSGEKTVLIPQGVAVVTYAPGTMAELQPGAHVIFFPMTAADGSLTASQINVGKNSLIPPM
jgi:hypothetical protein